MSRPKLEVADSSVATGARCAASAGHVSLDQLKVMSAIQRCRTAALGGHVERCERCSHTIIAYNSCRNRHCPKCQSVAAREWRVRSGPKSRVWVVSAAHPITGVTGTKPHSHFVPQPD